MKTLASLAIGLVLISAPVFAEDSANNSMTMSNHVLRADEAGGRAAMRDDMLSWRAARSTVSPATTAGRSFATEPQISQTAATQSRGS